MTWVCLCSRGSLSKRETAAEADWQALHSPTFLVFFPLLRAVKTLWIERWGVGNLLLLPAFTSTEQDKNICIYDSFVESGIGIGLLSI
jgi:hypothetical protein